MRERAIEEFESLFEQASIPVLDIEDIDLKRVSAVLKGTELDASTIAISSYLQKRFGASVTGHWIGSAERSLDKVRAGGIDVQPTAFGSTAELVGQVSIARSQLVIASETPEAEARFVDFDDLVQGAKPPILMIRRPVADPSEMFKTILHSLTGNFRQTQNFAFSFTLAEANGRLMLLHVIDEKDIADVRDVLKVSGDIDAEESAELLDKLTHHGERYLKAVVAASRDEPYEVSYRLSVGHVVSHVKDELARTRYGLLIVGHHEEGHSQIGADDYQLMHEVRDVPVLAL